jgi:hypothetical protein
MGAYAVASSPTVAVAAVVGQDGTVIGPAAGGAGSSWGRGRAHDLQAGAPPPVLP